MLAENSCVVSLKEWVQVAAYVAAILAALGSWWQYNKNSKRERSRWLFELYQRFYSDSRLKDMSARIDWGDTSFAREESDRELCEKLDE